METKRCAAQLVRSAAAIRSLCAGSPIDPHWRPEPGKWSMVEVVCHLADEDRDDFRRRLDLTLHRPGTPWPPNDPAGWVTERGYASRSLPDALADFLAERERSVAWLSALGAADLSAAYQHPRVGPVHVGDLLLSWLNHDLLHLRQLTRLEFAWNDSAWQPYSSRYAGEW
jgi:hypothetical protein